MKIEPIRQAPSAQGAKKAGEVSRFELGQESAAPSRVAAASSATAAHGIDALLALQGGEPDARSRQARRGRRLLDALDRLTRALLEGVAPAGLRSELHGLRGQAEPTGEEGLDALLREIDTRAAVELAKLDALAAPA
ncbi:MAG: flagellar assembly protein FliX [Hyphomonadaceae bacterium]|nr:flagellar assembly protein FliX [Hyphomonadaceae bacterium]